jgi:hypothetical protein
VLQASAFRNRILRSVDFAVALDDVTSGDISSVGHDYIPDAYDYLNPFTNKARNLLVTVTMLVCLFNSNIFIIIHCRQFKN